MTFEIERAGGLYVLEVDVESDEDAAGRPFPVIGILSARGPNGMPLEEAWIAAHHEELCECIWKQVDEAQHGPTLSSPARLWTP